MVSVTFKGVRPGTCSWCRKDKNQVFLVSEKPAGAPKAWCWSCFGRKIQSELDGTTENTGGLPVPTSDAASGSAQS